MEGIDISVGVGGGSTLFSTTPWLGFECGVSMTQDLCSPFCHDFTLRVRSFAETILASLVAIALAPAARGTWSRALTRWTTIRFALFSYHFIVLVTNKHSSDLECTPLRSLRADTADELQFSWFWGLSKQLLLLSSGLYESRVLWQNQLGDYFRLDCNWVEAISQGNFLTTDLLYAGL